jgi:hypothetical protein
MVKEQTPSIRNLYSRLGINRSATDEQVRTAYYRLAKLFHPDRRKGGERDEETFKSIVRAAAILRDPARRKLYDRGAIDENGALAGTRGLWPRWSYREQGLACVVAGLTVLASGLALYSMNTRERALLPASAHAGREDKTPAAAISHGVSLAQPAAQSNVAASAPRIDQSPAELFQAILSQQAVHSPPAANSGNQAEIASAAIAAAADDVRNQVIQRNSIILKKPAASKNRIPSNSNNIVLSAQTQKIPRMQSECSLTSAAREILAGIISR